MSWRPMDGELFPSLGWTVADQMAEYLAAPDDGDAYAPFMVSREQLEFLVRLYEVDPHTGHRVKHRAVLQRPRGWGKSPFLAAIGIAEALFDVVFDGWDAQGQPVGKPWSSIRTPLVLITATTEEQTANTWGPLLEMLRGGSVVDEFDVEPMDSFVNLPKGRIEQRTSSATSVKGAPAVAAIMDQTESWVPGNRGPRFAQTLRNNATKRGGMTIESPNAFVPGERSVAEASAKMWQDIRDGKVRDSDAARGLLYDDRQAPGSTDLDNRESLVAGLRYAYGDSSDHPDGCVLHDPPCAPGWSPIFRIAADFQDRSNDLQTMRQDFLNQVTHATDSFVSEPALRAIMADGSPGGHPVKTISKSEPITLGFDGSEGRKDSHIADSTVLIGYSLTQKHWFKLGVWEQPDGPTGEGWRPPVLEVEAAVKDAFRRYNVVGFYADPSAGWAGHVKTWEAEHYRVLKAKMSVNEPIRWRQKDISRTTETFDQMFSAITAGDVTFDGSSELLRHMLHARRDPRRSGYVLKKPDDDQDYSKIDACYGMAFAYAAAMDAIGKGVMASGNRRAPKRIY